MEKVNIAKFQTLFKGNNTKGRKNLPDYQKNLRKMIKEPMPGEALFPVLESSMLQKCSQQHKTRNPRKKLRFKVKMKYAHERNRSSIMEASRILDYYTEKCQKKVVKAYKQAKCSGIRRRVRPARFKVTQDVHTSRNVYSPVEKRLAPSLLRSPLTPESIKSVKMIDSEIKEGDSRLKIFKLYTNLNWENSRISRCMSPLIAASDTISNPDFKRKIRSRC
ncbi:unnamed protein product [Moneuplotes crassus]|uniref:Uncharacterized protein n=1 Tax=Euplotes crassus TaxID=5936 RepID=A0AAD1X194_EUPCR|nr:unnamed protein product [Moneuplotes crassus]